MNQARATYPGGVSELDAALHLLHPPDEDLEAGEVTVFVEGADEASARPRPTNPVYSGTRPTPPYAVVYEAFPREPTWCPALPPATHAPRGWANPHLSPPLSRTRGAHHRGQVLWQECPGTPLLLLVVATRGDPGRILGITPTHLYGATPVPRPPPPGARGAGRNTHLPANTGGHRRYGGPPGAAAPDTAKAGGGPRTSHGRLVGGRHGSEGEREGRARGCGRDPVGRDTASAGHAATPSTPRKRGRNPARATDASPAAAAAAAVGRESAKYRAHANPTHTHTSPPKPFPPKPFPPARERHVRPPTRERSPPGVTLPQLQRQRDARRVVQEGRSSGGEQSAGSGRRDSGQGAGKGLGHGKGAQGRGPGAQVQGAGRGEVGERAGQGVGDGRRDPRHGQGAGKGPKGKGKGAAGPKGQAGRGMGALGGGRGEGRGAEGGAPPQPDVQPVRCIPPGIQQMPAHHTHHHHHHHHHHLYNIDPDASELVPPQPPRHQHHQAPPAPRAEPARMASAEGGRGAASAPQAQGQRGGPARGAEEGRPWDRDWGAVPDPLGEETLPLVGEVYGWLCWANQGTSRRSRNRPFDAVLLQRDGGNREVPPGGWAAPENHERVLRSVIRAAWPDREPTWPAFLEGGAVLRITDADANNWLPRALRSALAHWPYRRHNTPSPQPQPPHKRRRR